MIWSRGNIANICLLVSFLATVTGGQQTSESRRSIVDSASAVDAVRAYFIQDNFNTTRKNLQHSDVYFSNWRIRRILSELPTVRFAESELSGCVADNFRFANVALTNLSKLDGSLFLLIAEPQNSWVMASFLQERDSDTTSLKKLHNRLAPSDRSSLIDALNCYKIYDRFHVVLLYDSTRGCNFIRQIYSPEGIKLISRETSDGRLLQFLDYGYGDFGGDRVDRTLVCYGISKGSLEKLLEFRYHKMSGFNETRRDLSYSFEGDTLMMRGLEWPGSEFEEGLRHVGWPDSSKAQHISLKFFWKSGQFILPRDITD